MSDTTLDKAPAGGPAGAAGPASVALRLEGVSKSFPGVRALSEVNVECRAGTVHALVGENGSGKSTLVKVACGVLRPDEGTVTIAGSELTRASARAARRLGLYAAYQDTALVADMTVLENVMLSFTGSAGHAGPLKRAQVGRLLEPYDLGVRLDTRVANLSPGKRQLLEVVRALLHSPRILLLDEPTATLDANSIARLETMIGRARDAGVAILYISHRLEEVERLADEVTVLRDGEIHGHYTGGGWSVPEVVALMVGAPVDLSFPDKAADLGNAAEALRVSEFSGAGFGPVELSVRHGEIVGIGGAEGNGQRQLVRALVGLQSADGAVALDGSPTQIPSPAAALQAGVRFLSGDRVAESIFADMSVMNNATVSALDQLSRFGTIRRDSERRLFEPAVSTLGIVAASPDQPIRELSGGNQQKTVMARAIIDPARVLVVDEPTQGVDAMSRIDIYRALRDQADSGCGILVNSSDSLELAGLCDRVYVVSRGMITEELSGDALTESAVVQGFVSTAGRDARRGDDDAHPALRSAASVVAAPWFPLTAVLLLIVLVGAYAQARSEFFLGTANLNALLALSLPLIVVAIGQQVALLARGFDISVGAMMSLTVVMASFSITSESLAAIIPGLLLVLALGCTVGLVNGFVVRVLNVNAIIATIGMLGILNGIALMRRPEPGGLISPQLTTLLLGQIGFVPVAFVVIVLVAVGAQVALLHTGAGLELRATGFNEEAANRLGVRVTAIKIGAFAACSTIAAVAGLFLAAQTGIGSPGIGDSYALLSIAACVIGGASLGGGRGSFVGCLVAGVFLSLLVNIAPLLQLSPSYSQLITGLLTLLAVLAYTLNRRAAR